MVTVEDSGIFFRPNGYRQIAWPYISISQKLIHITKYVAMTTA